MLEGQQLSLKSKVWAGTAARRPDCIQGTAIIQAGDGHDVSDDDGAAA